MDINTETKEETPKLSKKKKNGLPGWAWALVVILPIMALFSLTMMCGEPPEQSRYANKNKSKANVNPKNNPQTNVKPKTNVANLNKDKTKTNANRPNKAKKPVNNKPKNQATTNPQTGNNAATKNNTKPIAKSNNKANNTVPIQNQNKVQGTNNQTTRPQTKQQNTNQQQPKNNSKATTNATNTSTVVKPKPATKTQAKPAKSTNTSNIKSKYKGSASKVDIAAQTNQTEIINFGTVTNNDKVLTPSAYSNFIKISQILIDNPKATITLRTHNRDFNHNPSNQKAKQQGKVRADLLKKILVDSGIATNRIKVDLIGHIEPLIEQDPSHTRNKRVTVQIN